MKDNGVLRMSESEAIRNSFTDEEIRLKYGRLVIMSKSEYEEYTKKIKRKR